MSDKFRRKKEPKHIRLYASITNSEAWKHLSGNSVKVLLALVARDNGERNGNIGFSVREAAEAGNIAINTASRCLQELQDLGFIARTEKGAFSRKISHASLWRYTWQAAPGCRPAAPTRDFEKWKPDEKSRSQKLTSAVSNIETGNANKAATVSKINTAPPEKPLNCVGEPISNIDTLTIYQRDRSEAPAATSTIDSPPDTGGDLAALDGQVEMWAMPAPVQPPCEQCGGAITALSKNGLKRFCGEPCRKRAERNRAKDRRREATKVVA